MRLAYVCQDPGIPPDGTKGASVHFRQLERWLREEFDDVATFMARGPRDGTRWTPTVVSPRSPSLEDARGTARELGMLAGQEPMLAALSAAGEVDAVYERYSLFGLASTTFARAREVPHLLEVNALLWEEASAYRELELVDLAREIGLTVMRGASRVLAVSARLAERIVELGVAADRVEVFSNGVDDRAFRDAVPASRPQPLRDRPVVLFAGSLKPWHGVDAFLYELARSPETDWGVWIVGDGPLRSTVEAFVREFPDRAAWWPGVDHERMPGIYAAADCSVAPYPADAPDYFSPLKVIESLAAGCPVLTTRTCRLPEDLDGSPGVVRYSPSVTGSLPRALHDLLEDPAASRQAAAATREHVLSQHSWRARAAAIRAWAGGVPSHAERVS